MGSRPDHISRLTASHPVVELVLGAGNLSSIAPRDLLYGMFVENRVVVLKCNPVNDYLAPHWERSLRALVESGFLRIVRGDAAAGAYLVSHLSEDRQG